METEDVSDIPMAGIYTDMLYVGEVVDCVRSNDGVWLKDKRGTPRDPDYAIKNAKRWEEQNEKDLLRVPYKTDAPVPVPVPEPESMVADDVSEEFNMRYYGIKNSGKMGRRGGSKNGRSP